ncbi:MULTISPECIES: glycosyltransferase family protein [Geobacillus]|uniref:glycosyltransferase family 4 protein n=1 Tax=Geobacillus TaxID=129337 RepID=UPI000A4D7F7B|nr:glycosyltransferase family 4 protein [Geobacillus sp. DSP4a]NNU99404.1 hypothetical protein [Geobacillus sp. DSP4a]
MSLKMFYGLISICGLNTTFAKAFREKGYDTKSVSFLKHYFEKADIDFDINKFTKHEKIAIRQKIFEEHKDHYDIFHFFFAHTFLYDQKDLTYLSSKGKKLFMHHNGTDVRRPSVLEKFNPYARLMYKDFLVNEDEVVKYIKNCAEWIPVSIVQDLELAEYVQPFYDYVEILPLPIDLGLDKYSIENYDYEPITSTRKRRLKIMHAPTNRTFKGTDYIVDTIKKVCLKRNDIEFILIENQNHNDFLKELAKGDIIIDHLLYGTYGMLSIEAMALKKPVITYINDFVKKGYPHDLPIISATIDNLEEVIDQLVDDKEKMIYAGEQGRKYVEEYHDLEKVVLPRLIDIYRKYC